MNVPVTICCTCFCPLLPLLIFLICSLIFVYALPLFAISLTTFPLHTFFFIFDSNLFIISAKNIFPTLCSARHPGNTISFRHWLFISIRSLFPTVLTTTMLMLFSCSKATRAPNNKPLVVIMATIAIVLVQMMMTNTQEC